MVTVTQSGPGYFVECTAAEAAAVEETLLANKLRFRMSVHGALVTFACNGSGQKAADALKVVLK